MHQYYLNFNSLFTWVPKFLWVLEDIFFKIRGGGRHKWRSQLPNLLFAIKSSQHMIKCSISVKNLLQPSSCRANNDSQMSAFIPLQTPENKYNVFQHVTTCRQTLQVHLYCAEKCSTFNYQTGSESVCNQQLGSLDCQIREVYYEGRLMV